MKTVVFCKECELRHFVNDDKVSCECGHVTNIFSDIDRSGPHINSCAVCGYEHFHLRKDFPRRIGLAIVTLAAISMWWMPGKIFFLPLILASLVDLALFQILPWKVVCYVCSSEYLGYEPEVHQKPFDLEHATEYRRLRWPKNSVN
jgi:hypothetical protein